MIKMGGHIAVYLPKSEYYELPSKYNKTVVRLLVQSPTRMFVFWEVSDDTIRQFNSHNAQYSDSIPVLKIKNITMNYSYDMEIDPFTNNYYIEVKDPDCIYEVELGRKYKNKFIDIYTSNTAKIPRSSPMPISFAEEVIYRNCIKLTTTEKFTIYAKKRSYNIDGSKPQDYNILPFSSETDSNGISSFENVSSFNRYEENEDYLNKANDLT